jgi:hypothetical protein
MGGPAQVFCSYELQVELFLLLRVQPTSATVADWDS